ncbi:hypothetical protein LP417_18955 [Polaromonas sp. P1-6]|nr:hypothetical protein LP417_18955 [Polaromonas sp. P1-6]
MPDLDAVYLRFDDIEIRGVWSVRSVRRFRSVIRAAAATAATVTATVVVIC